MAIQVQGKYLTAAPTLTAGGTIQPLLVDSSGNLLTSGKLTAGSAIIGNVRIDQTTPGTTNAVALKGTTDAGTTWAGVKVDASGDQYTVQTMAGLTNTHTAPTVGTNSGTALSSNANRRYALLVNNSPAAIFLNVAGGSAALSTGIVLNPAQLVTGSTYAGGGSYEISAANGNLYTGNITAIATAASSNLLVTEGV